MKLTDPAPGEAAVQCERLTLPRMRALERLDDALGGWTESRPLLVALERAQLRGVEAEPLLRAAQQLSCGGPSRACRGGLRSAYKCSNSNFHW